MHYVYIQLPEPHTFEKNSWKVEKKKSIRMPKSLYWEENFKTFLTIQQLSGGEWGEVCVCHCMGSCQTAELVRLKKRGLLLKKIFSSRGVSMGPKKASRSGGWKYCLIMTCCSLLPTHEEKNC